MFPPPFGRGGPRGMMPRMMRPPPLNTGPGLLGEAPGIPNPAGIIPNLRFPPGFVPPEVSQGFPDFNGEQANSMRENAGDASRMKNEDSPVREPTPTPVDEDQDLSFGSMKERDEDERMKDSDMPQAQKRLYERIQQKQKERKASLEVVKQTNPVFNEENWYSSDEENADAPSACKKAKVGDKSPAHDMPDEKPKEHEEKTKRDPRMRRDPRQRINPPPVTDDEKEKRILNIDLSDLADLDIPTFTKQESPKQDEEENELGLPFKPHKVHSVAKEIDASIYSHSPLEYKLRLIVLSKPDYSDMIFKQHIPASKVQIDPRLRRYAGKKPANDADEAYSSMPLQQMKAEDNVYNPKQDLYPTQPGPSRKNDAQDYYDPSDEVQDLYGGMGRSRRNEGQPNVYNPRQELDQAQGSTSWGNPNQGGYAAALHGGGGYGRNQGHPDGSAPSHRQGNKDPRANRRDPRRRD